MNISSGDVIDLVMEAKLEERKRIRDYVTKVKDMEQSVEATTATSRAMQGHLIGELDAMLTHVLGPQEDGSSEPEVDSVYIAELDEEDEEF